MEEALREREDKLREFFGLPGASQLAPGGFEALELTPPVSQHLARFNMEWHVIPSADTVPFDEAYVKKLYPMCARNFAKAQAHGLSCLEALARGHRRHQGHVVGVETTIKPRYLPGNKQYYGTPYGFDATTDPFAQYLGRAGFLTGTRFAHNYVSLREFIDVVNKDWRARGLMPQGFRITICPPAVFNLVGTLFHPEWSQTEALELGFYRDDHGNAKCYAVGSNAPGDFSYIHDIETDSEWTLLGFRLSLVPE